MQIGLATLICSSIQTAPDNDLLHCMPLFREAGVTAIEYNDQSLPRYWCDDEGALRAVAAQAQRDEIQLWSAHNPCAEWDLSSPDRLHWQAAVEAHAAMIRRLAAIGVQHFVVHHVSGPVHRDPSRAERGRQAIEALLPLAEKAGITLLVENFANWPVAKLLPLVQAFDSEYLGIVVDVGHAHHSALPVTPAEEIRLAGQYLRSLHIHDNHGPDSGDEHLPPGWGTIDWPEVLRALKEVDYSGPFMMEVIRHTPAMQSIPPDEAVFVAADAARSVLAQFGQASGGEGQ